VAVGLESMGAWLYGAEGWGKGRPAGTAAAGGYATAWARMAADAGNGGTRARRRRGGGGRGRSQEGGSRGGGGLARKALERRQGVRGREGTYVPRHWFGTNEGSPTRMGRVFRTVGARVRWLFGSVGQGDGSWVA